MNTRAERLRARALANEAILVNESLRRTARMPISQQDRSRMQAKQRDRLGAIVSEMATFGSAFSSSRLSPRGAIEMRAFLELLINKGDGDKDRMSPETRDLLEGIQSPLLTWTAGVGGGYAVPAEFYAHVTEAMAQFDPLLDEDVVNLIQEEPEENKPALQMRPLQVPGVDLSTVASTQIAEGAQTQTVPITVNGKMLNGFTHKASLRISIEAEQDYFLKAATLISRFLGVAFARGIGKQLINGSGNGQPQGLLNGAANSGITTAAGGQLSLADFMAIYFAVNRAYRVSPKCCWLMSDPVYEYARKAVDSQNRPLIAIEDDVEKILGKRVLISPSLPSANGSAGGIVFGDLSYFHVRLSWMTLDRSFDKPGLADYGVSEYDGRQRVDSVVDDPSGGNTPPIVYATLHS